MTIPQDLGASGYSGTPLPRKLGIKAGYHVLFHNAPETFDPQPLPYGVTLETTGDGGAEPYDLIVAFAADRATLTEDYATLPALLAKSGALWICWPKKTSKVPTDVTEAVVRGDALALPAGLVDVKIAAIDATWSGLKLVYRLDRR